MVERGEGRQFPVEEPTQETTPDFSAGGVFTEPKPTSDDRLPENPASELPAPSIEPSRESAEPDTNMPTGFPEIPNPNSEDTLGIQDKMTAVFEQDTKTNV